MVKTVLYGRGGMPRFNDIFTDDEMASVISYVRSGLGSNHASVVHPDYIAGVRVEVEGTPIPSENSSVGQKGEGEVAASPTP